MSKRQAVVIKPSITKEELRIQVEKLVTQDGMTYAESIIEICERKQIDPEDMAKLVKGPLKLKLEVEAMDRNIIKRTTSTLF
jgi:hypothetical protein|tara:strand:+ start:1583 stop:1828 length:246 start_codon:yes stop_codon:yes gene_type:complete